MSSEEPAVQLFSIGTLKLELKASSWCDDGLEVFPKDGLPLTDIAHGSRLTEADKDHGKSHPSIFFRPRECFCPPQGKRLVSRQTSRRRECAVGQAAWTGQEDGECRESIAAKTRWIVIVEKGGAESDVER